jgi:hypothetical protein
MFNVSIRDYFSNLNVFIVCIDNAARSKSLPLMCTHVDSYKFSTVHPPSDILVLLLGLGGGHFLCIWGTHMRRWGIFRGAIYLLESI